MKSYKIFNQRGMSLSLSNFTGLGKNAPATCDIADAIKEAKDGKEILANLSELDLVGYYRPQIEKENAGKVRIRFEDGMGNKRFIEAEKEPVITRTAWYKLFIGSKDMPLVTEYLSNRYKTEVSSSGQLFVSEDEIEEVLTILDDNGISYVFD